MESNLYSPHLQFQATWMASTHSSRTKQRIMGGKEYRAWLAACRVSENHQLASRQVSSLHFLHSSSAIKMCSPVENITESNGLTTTRDVFNCRCDRYVHTHKHGHERKPALCGHRQAQCYMSIICGHCRVDRASGAPNDKC
jgi:hypothetical protein